MVAGRYEEGVDLHRNALLASPLGEVESMNHDLGLLDSLVGALFATQRFDEMENTRLLPRLEAAAKKESRRVRVVCYQEATRSFAASTTTRNSTRSCLRPTWGTPLHCSALASHPGQDPTASATRSTTPERRQPHSFNPHP